MIRTVQLRRALLLAQVGDLLGDVGEVEVQIGAACGPAAQRLRLTLRPGVEVAVVEVGLGFVHQRTIRLCTRKETARHDREPA